MKAAAILLFFLFLLILGAHAAGAHEPYSEWKMPGTDVSCCSDKDCGPVTATPIGNGAWVVKVNGIEVVVTPDRVLKIPSPDGRSHWCGFGTHTYCFVPGEVRI
jgi:hypothetical protein